MNKIFPLIILLICFSFNSFSQKVGVVLSGGGAKGLAHIGVLKAFEENNIPVDYIAGTSMGGLVGGLYAAGYSPREMEYIAQSKDFQNWVSGYIESYYNYYFKKKNDNAAIVSLGLGLDSTFQARVRSSLVNDIPLNFGFLQLAAQASANSERNFDSLYIPFRCMAADVFSQEQICIKKGSLADAMRATMTVPYIYRPIKIDNRYVFDGGLYNNFPVDVVKRDFHPDIIVGVNVSSKNYEEYPFDSDDELIARLFNYLLLSKTDSSLVSETGIYIQPDVGDYTVMEFRSAEALIRAGYDAAIAKMPAIKEKIKREVSEKQKDEERAKFINKKPPIRFNEIKIMGVNSNQRVYVRKVFRTSSQGMNLFDIKKSYYKLVADDNFQTVYPRITKKDNDGNYDFELDVKPERNFRAELGGNISSRPISSVFLGLQYNYLNKYSTTFTSDFYLGRFYEAIQTKARLDYPSKIPFYLEGEFTYNHWDYFKSSQIFLEDISLMFIDQTDRSLDFSLGIPYGNNGKVYLKIGGFNITDKFSQNNDYTSGDTLDESIFNSLKYALAYEKNTLNYKQFPTKGEKVFAGVTFYDGIERYKSGTQSAIASDRNARQWLKVKISYEKYLLSDSYYTFGYIVEAVASDQDVFTSHRSSLLMASTFYPMIDSRTLFLENYRAYSYAAVGVKNVFNLKRNIQLRLEGFVFQPYQKIIRDEEQKPILDKEFRHLYFAGTAALIYRSPLGPVSLNFNYYDDDKKQYGLLFNVGYLIFNKRPID
jgi:NTE family protein